MSPSLLVSVVACLVQGQVAQSSETVAPAVAAEAPSAPAPAAEAVPASEAPTETVRVITAIPDAPEPEAAAPAPSAPVALEVAKQPEPAPAPAPATSEDWPRFGAMLDVGVPDGAGLSLAFRPISMLRLTAGPASNGVGPGIRGSVAFVPFRTVVTPTLSLEGCHYFPGDANALLGGLIGGGQAVPVLSQLSYDYVAGHLGVELGSPKRFVFFLRAGLTYLTTTLRGMDQVLAGASGGMGNVEVADPVFRATLPTVKLGFLLWIG